MEAFGEALFWLIERLERWLDGVALQDRWRFTTDTKAVSLVKSSIYLEDELWWSPAPGQPSVASGLSGRDVGARPNHDVVVVTMYAGNSRRSRPIIILDRTTNQIQILEQNFAPLLRSPYEGRTLLAGIAIGALSFWVGLILLPLGGGELNPALALMSVPVLGLGISILFIGKRRQRLRAYLQIRCDAIAMHLRNGTSFCEELEIGRPTTLTQPTLKPVAAGDGVIEQQGDDGADHGDKQAP